jgi:hypothetical protein
LSLAHPSPRHIPQKKRQGPCLSLPSPAPRRTTNRRAPTSHSCVALSSRRQTKPTPLPAFHQLHTVPAAANALNSIVDTPTRMGMQSRKCRMGTHGTLAHHALRRHPSLSYTTHPTALPPKPKSPKCKEKCKGVTAKYSEPKHFPSIAPQFLLSSHRLFDNFRFTLISQKAQNLPRRPSIRKRSLAGPLRVLQGSL